MLFMNDCYFILQICIHLELSIQDANFDCCELTLYVVSYMKSSASCLTSRNFKQYVFPVIFESFMERI